MCTGGSVNFIDHRNVEHVRRLRRRQVFECGRFCLFQLRSRQVFSEFSGCGRFYLHRLRRRQVLRSPRLDFSGFGIVREVRSWILFCICGGSHMYIVSGGADKRGRQYLSK